MRGKRSLSIVNFEQQIATMLGTQAGQPFAGHRRFRKRSRRPQTLQFCGDDRRIRSMHVLIKPRLLLYTSIVPRKTARSEAVAIFYENLIVYWLLSCEQHSLPCHVSCMHLPNCHPRHRDLRLDQHLDELRYCRAISGRSLVQWLPPGLKAYNRGFPLRSTRLQKALLPLLLWLPPFCSLTQTLPPLSHNVSLL